MAASGEFAGVGIVMPLGRLVAQSFLNLHDGWKTLDLKSFKISPFLEGFL
jgi:hypothetical protein